MHHTLAWRLSIADATEVDVTPVQDGLMAIQNTHFFPAHDMSLLAIYFGAATPTRARLVTPAFRQITRARHARDATRTPPTGPPVRGPLEEHA
jgi:hypothetical protein